MYFCSCYSALPNVLSDAHFDYFFQLEMSQLSKPSKSSPPCGKTVSSDPLPCPVVTAASKQIMHSDGSPVISSVQQLSRTSVDRRRYLAGFTAGCTSRTVTAPIDRLKVLRQAAAPEIAGQNMFQCKLVSAFTPCKINVSVCKMHYTKE